MNALLSLIVLIFSAVFTFFYWAAFVLLAILTGRKLSMAFHRAMAHFWASFILKLFRIRVTIQGLEHLGEAKRRIIIVNHQSNLEILWPCLILPQNYFAIGKKEILYIPFFNLLWWASRMVLIDRKNKDSALQTMQAVKVRLLSEDSSLLVAPEGTRARHGELLPFKKGAFRLAEETGVPIYPVVASGAGICMPKGALLPMPGEIYVRCLEPIETSAWTLEALEKEMYGKVLTEEEHAEVDKYGRLLTDEERAALAKKAEEEAEAAKLAEEEAAQLAKEEAEKKAAQEKAEQEAEAARKKTVEDPDPGTTRLEWLKAAKILPEDAE